MSRPWKSGGTSSIFPQTQEKISMATEGCSARPGRGRARRDGAESVSAGKRVFRCTKVTSDVRKVAVLSWFSVELPLAGLARFDGLVRRTGGRVTLERMDADTGIGRAELGSPSKPVPLPLTPATSRRRKTPGGRPPGVLISPEGYFFSTLNSARWRAALSATGFFAPVSFSSTDFSGASFEASQI